MRNIYFVRHAMPYFPNGEKYCIGQADFPLSEPGIIQAILLKYSTRELFLNKTVFSSRLIRAKKTADFLHEQPVVIQGLEEMHAGLWDGLSFSEIEKHWPDSFEKRVENKNVSIPGAESTEEGLARFLTAVNKCLDKSCGDIVIVAHATVFQAFLAYSCSTPLEESRIYKLPYCSVSKVSYDGDFHPEYWGKVYVPELCMELIEELREHTMGDIPYLRSLLKQIDCDELAAQLEDIM